MNYMQDAVIVGLYLVFVLLLAIGVERATSRVKRNRH